jgi:hypothetical protein
MEYKKNIQKLLIYCLKYIMNDDKNKDDDLLNNYNKFNMKMLKLTELKLYINNKYISKFSFYSHYIYNQIYDINYQPIKTLKLLNLENIDIEFYSSINGYFKDKSCIKIYIYSNLYLESNKKVIPEKPEVPEAKASPLPKIEIIEKLGLDLLKTNHRPALEKLLKVFPADDIKIKTNQSSTVLDENDLDIINWLNN